MLPIYWHCQLDPRAKKPRKSKSGGISLVFCHPLVFSSTQKAECLSHTVNCWGCLSWPREDAQEVWDEKRHNNFHIVTSHRQDKRFDTESTIMILLRVLGKINVRFAYDLHWTPSHMKSQFVGSSLRADSDTLRNCGRSPCEIYLEIVASPVWLNVRELLQ